MPVHDHPAEHRRQPVTAADAGHQSRRSAGPPQPLRQPASRRRPRLLRHDRDLPAPHSAICSPIAASSPPGRLAAITAPSPYRESNCAVFARSRHSSIDNGSADGGSPSGSPAASLYRRSARRLAARIVLSDDARVTSTGRADQ